MGVLPPPGAAGAAGRGAALVLPLPPDGSDSGLSLAGLAIFYCGKFRRERMKKLLAEQSAKTVLRGTNKVIVERQDSGEVVGPVWLIGQGGWPPAHDTPSADPSACAVGV
mgnify:CR=1 FL=1